MTEPDELLTPTEGAAEPEAEPETNTTDFTAQLKAEHGYQLGTTDDMRLHLNKVVDTLGNVRPKNTGRLSSILSTIQHELSFY